MKGVKLLWDRHVDRADFWCKHGFKIGYNFVIDVEESSKLEFESLVSSMSSVQVLSRLGHGDNQITQVILMIADDTEAVQFKMSIV